MLLSESKKGSTAKIVGISATRSIKDRFYSFGIMKGEDV